MTYPPILKPGDQIRVVAPSMSLSIISEEIITRATERLTKLGFVVTFSEHCRETDQFESSTIEHRLADLHTAFADPEVKGILTVIGGYNCNQLLAHLDYDLIRNNPKVFCGYSDTTALQNAILTKADLITYSSPAFSSFGERDGFDYSMDYFQRAAMADATITIAPAATWSDDKWYENQDKRRFTPNHGWWPLQPGSNSGRIIGGNLCTLNLLQGTPYMPNLKGSILFIEDDNESCAETFDRDLQSLLQQPGIQNIRGLVIGRFQRASRINRATLKAIIQSKSELANLPVIGNVDFGHTEPRFTFPIGGKAKISVTPRSTSISIIRK